MKKQNQTKDSKSLITSQVADPVAFNAQAKSRHLDLNSLLKEHFCSPIPPEELSQNSINKEENPNQ